MYENTKIELIKCLTGSPKRSSLLKADTEGAETTSFDKKFQTSTTRLQKIVFRCINSTVMFYQFDGVTMCCRIIS